MCPCTLIGDPNLNTVEPIQAPVEGAQAFPELENVSSELELFSEVGEVFAGLVQRRCAPGHRSKRTHGSINFLYYNTFLFRKGECILQHSRCRVARYCEHETTPVTYDTITEHTHTYEHTTHTHRYIHTQIHTHTHTHARSMHK
jgi:hypothetical protein